MNKNIKLAIFSPNFSAYSQTFIKAHKERLGFKTYYYYGDFIPTHLEGKGKLSYLNNNSEDKLANLKKNLIDENIDVVLAEFGQTGAETFEVCKELKIPMIVHFHGYDAHQKDNLEKYGERYKAMFQYATSTIAVSNFMKRQLYSLGCPKEKLVYSTYGPSEMFLNTPKTFLKKQFISIGRFVDKKAPYFTIMAFSKILERHPDAMMLLGGQGILRNTCENLVKYYNITNSVQFLGVVEHHVVKELFSESLAYVQHSLQAKSGDCEGTPVAIIEASGAGLPVISTFHAGIPDVIKNGYSGILVEEGDVDGMSNAMDTLASDFNLAKKMSEAAREIVKKNFTMERHLDFLRKLISDSISS